MSTALFLSVFQQMVAFAHEFAMPMSFQNDLFVHDRGYLQSNQNAVFVWALFKSGTHVITLSGKDKPIIPVSYFVRQVHDTFEEDGCKLFFVDCRYGKVTPCDGLESCLELVRNHLEGPEPGFKMNGEE